MYSILISPHFRKELEKFLMDDPEAKPKVIRSLSELLTDPDHPSLRTHKLNSNKNWSLSIDMATRIIFELEGDEITLLSIGSHDYVYI